MKSANLVQLGASFLLGATVLLAACDQAPNSKITVHTGKPAAQDQLDQLSTPASLNQELPDEAVAYARIPSFWGFFNAPKKTMLDAALRDGKNVEAVLKAREGLGRYFNSLKMSEKIFFDLALNRLQSPIEVALLSLEQGKTPAFVVRAQLSFKSDIEFNTQLSKLAAQAPELKIVSPLNNSGVAQLSFRDYNIYIHFAAKRLTLIVAKSPQDQLPKIAELIKTRSTPHAMTAVEKQIDVSGQGMFFWTNPPGFALIKSLVGSKGSLLASLSFINSLAFGWGVADGKSRLRLHLGSSFDFSRYAGVMSKDINVSTAGQPVIAVVANLPDPEQWKALKAYLNGSVNSAQAKKYDEDMAEMRKYSGSDLDDLVAAFGSHAAFFIDESGEFWALQIRDKIKFKKLVAQWQKSKILRHEVNTIKNLSVHHFELGASEAMLKDLKGTSSDFAKSMFGELLFLYFRLKDHYYWVEEGDYLILARTPQSLVDRASHPQQTNLGHWLRKNQGVHTDQSIVLASSRIQDSPRIIYHSYLAWLGNLGDLANTPIDLAQMPTARELNLPKYGSYSVQLDLVKGGVAVDLTFENNPLELFLGSETITLAIPTVLFVIYYKERRNYVINTLKEWSGASD